MTRSKIFLALSLVIGHWSLVIPTMAEPLRWKLKTGEELVAKIEQKSEVASTLGGAAPTVMTLEAGLEMTWKVTHVDEQGAADITQRFQRLRMKLEMPKSGAISYDTASQTKPAGDAKMIATAIGPLLDAEVKLTLSPGGEITSVELGETAQKVVEGLDAASPLKALLSKEGLSNILKQSLVVLPEKEVKSGDSWQREASLSTALGKFKQTTTFKLQPSDDASSDVARIESNSELELEQPGKGKATLKQQQQKGVILFDQTAGRLRSAEVEQELVTASSLKDTPIQVRLTSTLKMTLEKK
jgi:hypothetical protein